MTKIKLCGMQTEEDIDAINEILPEYAGFVFWDKSRRFIARDRAHKLKRKLDDTIKAVGVFVDEKPEEIAALYKDKIIDIAQLHGREDENYIEKLRSISNIRIIKAFQLSPENDNEKNMEIIKAASKSTADYIMLDAGKGCGNTFDWKLVKEIERPFFLAGGLGPQNVSEAIEKIHPYAVDVSSGIETDGKKDEKKMADFVQTVRRKSYRPVTD